MSLLLCVAGFLIVVLMLAELVNEGYQHSQLAFIVMGLLMCLGGVYLPVLS